MSSFPKLKTGAIAQYPATRALTYTTEIARFLDGSEQRYRAASNPEKRWVIRLELLDDTETARVREFVGSVQGRYGAFSFEDPWDGTVHPNCSLESDELITEVAGEARTRMEIVIRENTY